MISSKRRPQARSARTALTDRERALAYTIANFIRRGIIFGWGDDRTWATIARLWPDAGDDILDAAELFLEARRDGWEPPAP
jgi:hypothetical protein